MQVGTEWHPSWYHRHSWILEQAKRRNRKMTSSSHPNKTASTPNNTPRRCPSSLIRWTSQIKALRTRRKGANRAGTHRPRVKITYSTKINMKIVNQGTRQFFRLKISPRSRPKVISKHNSKSFKKSKCRRRASWIGCLSLIRLSMMSKLSWNSLRSSWLGRLTKFRSIQGLQKSMSTN